MLVPFAARSDVYSRKEGKLTDFLSLARLQMLSLRKLKYTSSSRRYKAAKNRPSPSAAPKEGREAVEALQVLSICGISSCRVALPPE